MVTAPHQIAKPWFIPLPFLITPFAYPLTLNLEESRGLRDGGPVAMTTYLLCKGPGLIPDQGNRSHMLQLRVWMPQLKILCSATKTQCNQVNKYNLKKKKNEGEKDEVTLPAFVLNTVPPSLRRQNSCHQWSRSRWKVCFQDGETLGIESQPSHSAYSQHPLFFHQPEREEWPELRGLNPHILIHLMNIEGLVEVCSFANQHLFTLLLESTIGRAILSSLTLRRHPNSSQYLPAFLTKVLWEK